MRNEKLKTHRHVSNNTHISSTKRYETKKWWLTTKWKKLRMKGRKWGNRGARLSSQNFLPFSSPASSLLTFAECPHLSRDVQRRPCNDALPLSPSFPFVRTTERERWDENANLSCSPSHFSHFYELSRTVDEEGVMNGCYFRTWLCESSFPEKQPLSAMSGNVGVGHF